MKNREIDQLIRYLTEMESRDARITGLCHSAHYSLRPRWKELVAPLGYDAEAAEDTYFADLSPDEQATVAAAVDEDATLDAINRDEPGEMPTWALMDLHDVSDECWVAHCTNFGVDISTEGFTVGARALDTLALTKHRDEVDGYGSGEPGYNFGYPLHTFERVGFPRRGGGECAYGPDVVLVKTSKCLTFWHGGDEQYQVVFWGPDVQEAHYVEGDPGDWSIDDPSLPEGLLNEDGLLIAESLDDLADLLR